MHFNDEELTSLENMLIFGQINGLTRKQVLIPAEELLKQFQLYDVLNKMVKSFSGGMRRRCDLSVGLIMCPKIIFLDEPTTGLDPRTRGEMWDLIRAWQKADQLLFLQLNI